MIRQKAIQTLSKVKKTIPEENQLLAKLEDQDDDVRKAAVQAAAKISVTEQNLDAVKQLAGSSNWAAREEAVKLLGRINSQNATNELIGKLGDRDEDVRKEVVVQLSQKSLDEKNIPALARQLTNSDWSVRNDAAKFLGRIDSDSAVMKMIGAMSDHDEDVRKTIFDRLSRRRLGEGHVIALAKQYGSHLWSVRRDVTKLLGKIKSAASLEALQDQLLKETDDDVRNQIIASIRAVK